MRDAPTTGSDTRKTTGPIDFRPLARGDFPLLRQWLTAPHVRAWWGDEPPELPGIEQKYGPRVDNQDPVRVFVILLVGTPVGMIQCCHLDGDPDRERTVGISKAVGIDYLIGDGNRCGHGLGTAAIAAFTRLVLHLYPDISTITADPARDNHASRRVLEKAGYCLHDTHVVSPAASPKPGGSVIYKFQRPQ
jgi:RimJ/RimL family protein N-acetyltransferase